MKQIIATFLSMVLAACSDSNSEISNQQKSLNIVALGDSTINANNYDMNKLRVNLPIGSTIQQYGISGQCAIEGQQNNIKIIENSPKASVVIFLYGINDARRCGTSVAQFKTLVLALNEATKLIGGKFVVITPNPTFRGNENAILTQYAEMERGLDLNIADLRSWIEDPSVSKPFDYAYEVRIDGTHMSPIIYDWLSPKLAQVIVNAK